MALSRSNGAIWAVGFLFSCLDRTTGYAKGGRESFRSILGKIEHSEGQIACLVNRQDVTREVAMQSSSCLSPRAPSRFV